MQYVEDTEKTNTPCWVGFSSKMDKDKDKIPLTFKEEEAAKWMLMGWDVGYLAKGLANAEEVKWLT